MPLGNINPLFFLSPAVPVIFSFALVFYWKAKRSLRWVVLLYALVAYASAIALKEVIQVASAAWVVNNFGSVSIEYALYLGLQTVFLEVGIAYAVARYAYGKNALYASDAESYGISLSFWENGILLGMLSLVSLLSDYFIIATFPSLGGAVRYALISGQPGLFEPTSGSTLINIGLSVLERLSSLMAHFAWGVLTVIAAARRKPGYFLVALPMGLLDALVPYASTLGIYTFELAIFILGLIFLAIAIWAERREKACPSSEKKLPA